MNNKDNIVKGAMRLLFLILKKHFLSSYYILMENTNYDVHITVKKCEDEMNELLHYNCSPTTHRWWNHTAEMQYENLLQQKQNLLQKITTQWIWEIITTLQTNHPN